MPTPREYLDLDTLAEHTNPANQNTAWKSRNRRFIREASRFLELETGRRFDRYYRAVQHPFNEILDNGALYNLRDLVTIDSITNGDGTAISADDLRLIPDEEAGTIYGLDLVSVGEYWTRATNTRQSYITIAGERGWGGRWRSQGTVSGAQTATDEQLELSSYSRLKVGSLLKITKGSEYEYVIVDEEIADTPTYALVVRGENGSTALALDGDEVVQRFEVDPLIESLMIQLVQFITEVDKNPTGVSIAVNQTEVSLDFSRLPRHIQQKIEPLKRTGSIDRVGL